MLARPGEVIEFVNMDETARSIGTRPNLAAMQASGAQDEDVEAVYLDVGESHLVEVAGATTYYDVQNENQRAVISVGGGMFLPIIGR